MRSPPFYRFCVMLTFIFIALQAVALDAKAWEEPVQFNGSVLRFHGHTFAEVADSRELVDFTRPLTIEFWVRLDGKRWDYWIAGNRTSEKGAKGVRHVGWAVYVGRAGGQVRLIVFGARLPPFDLTRLPDAWYHIAICGDGRELSLFVNGLRIGKTDRIDKLSPSPRNIYLGRVPNVDHSVPDYVAKTFKGDLRAFSISSTCRYTKNFQPSKQIPRDKNTQVHLVLSGGMADTVADLSGNGRHAVVHNGDWVVVTQRKRP